MTGLYIIEEFQKNLPSINNLWAALSGSMSFLFIAIFWLKGIEEGTMSFLGKTYWSLTFFWIIMFMILPLYFCSKIPSYPAYKAIITSEIDMEKFNEKYEIVDEKNDIYTIKEK